MNGTMEGSKELELALKALGDLGSSTLSYAVFAATVGTIVMALLELAKAITYARRRFHEYEMRRWVERDTAYSVLDLFRDGSKGSARWREFLELLTGGYATQRAVFDQPVEKLMAQIQAATNMALDFPDRYPEMYRFLARPGAEGRASDAELWMKAAALRRGGGQEGAPAAEVLRAGAEARARLQNLVARQLDALQTEVHYRWSRTNQIVAISTGSALTFFVLLASQSPRGPGHIAVMVAMSLVAGLVSPFAKDVVSGLSGFARQVKA